MNKGGKISLNKKDIKYINQLDNNSKIKRNLSPQFVTNTILSDYINNKNNYFKNKKQKRNLNSPSYNTFLNNSNIYNLSSSYQSIQPEIKKEYEFAPQQNENEILLQKMKDLINQREKKKEKNVLNEYYTQHYLETMKKNIDTYPNGIKLSISNCETQYPINNLNDDDDFFKNLKILLETYENKKKNNGKKSPDHLNNEKKYNNNTKPLYINLLDETLTEHNNDSYIDNNDYINIVNKKNRNLSIEYNKTFDNTTTKIYENKNTFKEEKNNNKLIEIKNYTSRNNDKKSQFNKNINSSIRNRIRLINLYNQNKNKINLNIKLSKYNKTKSKNKKEKNIIKVSDEKEKYDKIQLFIAYLEECFILSLNNFFLYFIKQLKLYNKEKCKKNKDSINLLKRFQKSRNKEKYIFNSFSINNNFKYNNINNNTYNNNNSIEKYGKSKLYLTNSKTLKSNINPNIYIPKNYNYLKRIRLNKKIINQNNSSYDKNRKSLDLFPSLSKTNNAEFIDKINNLNINNNYKTLFTSNQKNNLIKSRNEYNFNNNFSYYKETEVKNNHFKYISSFDRSKNDDSLNESNNTNFKNNSHSKTKPIVYVKPKTKVSDLKKKFISKEKDNINNKNNKKNIKNKSLLFNKNKDLINKNISFFNELNEKNNSYNNNSYSSLLFKNMNENINKIPKKSNTPYRKENNKIIQKKNNNKYKKINGKILNNSYIEEYVLKDICTYDKRLWVTIKYITSEKSILNFTKMKIRRKFSNLSKNKNFFLNNKLKLLKPIKEESFKFISPLTLLNKHIMNGNNKFSVIIEDNNEDNNYKNLIIKLDSIFQKYEKQISSYFHKYFFDLLKANLNPLSQRQIFKDIKNNFKKISNRSICHISNDIIQKNDIDNNSDNDNNSQIRNREPKNQYWKRNLIPDNLNKKNKSYNKDILNIDLNKSDLYEKSKLPENINGIEKLDFSGLYNFTKKRKFKEKITKKDSIEEDEDEEIKMNNKIKFLLTNRFSKDNNSLRTIKKYFNIWRRKNNEYQDTNNIVNENENDNNNNNNIKQNINKCYKIIYNKENIDNNIFKKEKSENVENEEENESGGDNNNKDNLTNKIIKKEQFKKNKNNIFNIRLNRLIRINNKKRNEFNSLIDSGNENTPYDLDIREFEDKIEYFRRYLINYYAFKLKNISINEEEKEE